MSVPSLLLLLYLPTYRGRTSLAWLHVTTTTQPTPAGPASSRLRPSTKAPSWLHRSPACEAIISSLHFHLRYSLIL
ncbi:hypothetical protein GGS23DRAFT_559088 [Durotheca rogersii]|uniref:uncharacterized protein n=1 Tax=Durotheca rogersii TaxID=419775 RepID=UPI00221F4FDA|nr:uncharacterized protein GGS23DRAFT_559088 [Durotheca rogersii]KAI5865399.1 hypothetical protein GGS23DRAFT_559088 [Durotheca rogersii]